MAESIGEEVEWYADDAGNIIGIVVRDRIDNDWLYVIMGRDQEGAFRAFKTDVELPTREEARKQLQEAMREIEASGETVFPQ